MTPIIMSIIPSLFASTILSSAAPPLNDDSNVEIAISRAVAMSCSKSCTIIDLNLIFTNRTKVLYCVPAEYLSAYLSESITIVDRANGPVQRQSVPTRLRDYNADPIEQLREEPSLVLQPGEVVSRHVIIANKFELQPHPANIVASLKIFPCARGEAATIVHRIEADLQYQRGVNPTATRLR